MSAIENGLGGQNEPAHAGFRLVRLQVYNWGTFHGRVWSLEINGDNALLTGDIGSGKSSIVDALTTLLVPPARIVYNKAAGAEARERSLKSYVLGYYKAERAENSASARAVALRTGRDYSVILGQFANDAFGTVTLAQVFWTKDSEAQPERMYVVAEEALSVTEHFTNFGSDPAALRRRLKKAHYVVEDSFLQYAAQFRRRLGIANEQALELFNQTVSMKSVGNLTEFVRQHMLQPLVMDGRVGSLIQHFDDLNRAHESVLTAKAQIAELTPLVADCASHTEFTEQVVSVRGLREALRGWFAQAKANLLRERIERLESDLHRAGEKVRDADTRRKERADARDGIKRAIAENGGDRIEAIKRDIDKRLAEQNERKRRYDKYATLATQAGVGLPSDADAFARNATAIAESRETTEAKRVAAQNDATELRVAFSEKRGRHDELDDEIASLQQRRSNIPLATMHVRARLCETLGIDDADVPFVGELLQVRDEDAAWRGAVERLARSFGLSLLVSDHLYSEVASYVDNTNLRGRLVYFRVRKQPMQPRVALHSRSLAHKIQIKTDTSFYEWLDTEVSRRFDHACCENVEEFRREKRAVTRAGQTKDASERHEKDDSHRIDDAARYVLGWSNDAKIAALQDQRNALQREIADIGTRLSAQERLEKSLREQLELLGQMQVYDDYREIDWRSSALEVDALERERQALEASSDVLRTLQEQLENVAKEVTAADEEWGRLQREEGALSTKLDAARAAERDVTDLVAREPDAVRARFGEIEHEVTTVLANRSLSVETCEAREREVRDVLQGRVDALDKRCNALSEKIIRAMQTYRGRYPTDVRDADASLSAAGEYAAMLGTLSQDGLPKFEQRFKELLNENTIREIANFQSQLHRERQNILDRIDVINESLRGIDYNPGRFIRLEAHATSDLEVREFQQNLRACTEGSLTGSDDDVYSEAKFLQVKQIVERFRGRPNTTDFDQRWTRKVTDVRQWFAFSASERWREGDREHEHYTDSGGKSGGQKEKLAYTVLGASLAYQFGLELGATRSRAFHFVVIDEAFARGSDPSTEYALQLFQRLDLQLLVVTPLQKVHVIEPFVSSVGFVHNQEGRNSMLRNMTVEQYRAERLARSA